MLQGGTFLGPISTIPMVLFSGFFSKLSDIPWYLSWLTYVSFTRYSFEGTMIAIFGLDRPKMKCNQIYCHFRKPKDFLENFSLTGDFNTYLIDVIVLIALFVVLRVVAYFVLRIKLLQLR